jgi:site-specific recombinase XerD
VYASSGFDLLVTADLLGHESVATTQVYTKVDRTRASDAVRRLSL